jgi:hypothetical protein
MKTTLAIDRILWVLSVLAVCPAIAHGAECMAGPKVGVNLADWGGDDVDGDTDKRVGFVAGGFLAIGLHDAFAIQPEVVYTLKGIEDPDSDGAFKLNYIQIPMLAKVMIPTERAVAPYFLAGPAVGFQTDCEASGGGISIECDQIEGALGASFEDTEFGMIFGGGVGMDAGPGVLQIETRYDLGLTSILDPANGQDADIKNRVLSFQFGWGFPIGN